MSRPRSEDVITTRDDYIAAWYAALNSPCGVVLHADPPDAVRARLMQVRSQLGDEALAVLTVIKPVDKSNELWIVRK